MSITGWSLDWGDGTIHARQMKLGDHLWPNYPRVPAGAISGLDSPSRADQSVQAVESWWRRQWRSRAGSWFRQIRGGSFVLRLAQQRCFVVLRVRNVFGLVRLSVSD